MLCGLFLRREKSSHFIAQDSKLTMLQIIPNDLKDLSIPFQTSGAGENRYFWRVRVSFRSTERDASLVFIFCIFLFMYV